MVSEDMQISVRRNKFLSQSRRMIGRMVLLWALICGAVICPDAAAQPAQIVRWNIDATVVEVDDPLGLFPDVRLGDPVRGVLKYDLSVPIDPGYLSSFEFDPWFDVTQMTIQNPRNGTEFQFKTDPNGDFADVNVFNGYEDENGPFDGIITPQSVIAPAGFAGTAPVVDVVLQGPPTVFPPSDDSLPTQTHLPTTLNLDDWPIAAMEFQDGWFSDPTDTYIQAEIHSLTPVMAPYIPGDYNYDGQVDATDYAAWRASLSSTDTLYADGNGNGVIDAADYVIWRAHLGQSAGSGTAFGSSSNAAVPEPTTSLLLFASAGCCLWRRRAA
jgi:hypothetical protein